MKNITRVGSLYTWHQRQAIVHLVEFVINVFNGALVRLARFIRSLNTCTKKWIEFLIRFFMHN